MTHGSGGEGSRQRDLTFLQQVDKDGNRIGANVSGQTKGNLMTVSYFDTLAVILEAGETGADYVKFSRAMKAHTRSLVSEGFVAGYVLEDGEIAGAALNEANVVVCVTETGGNYVELLTEAGLLTSAPKPKTKRKTARKSKTTRSVPTPEESLSVPAVAPKGSKVRRVSGGSQDQAQVVKITQEDRVQALEAQLGALMDIIEGNLITAEA